MTAFEYLSVLLSIILGLAITQVLQGYRALLLARGQVKVYAPALIWSVLILLFATQAWWASFGLENQREWRFDTFLIILLQMALIYLMAAVVLPEMPTTDNVDLEAHYRDQRMPFFGCLLAVVVVSLLKDWMLSGALPHSLNVAFHGVLAVTAVAGMLIRGRTAALALALASAASFAAYVAFLFARL